MRDIRGVCDSSSDGLNAKHIAFFRLMHKEHRSPHKSMISSDNNENSCTVILKGADSLNQAKVGPVHVHIHVIVLSKELA